MSRAGDLALQRGEERRQVPHPRALCRRPADRAPGSAVTVIDGIAITTTSAPVLWSTSSRSSSVPSTGVPR